MILVHFKEFYIGKNTDYKFDGQAVNEYELPLSNIRLKKLKLPNDFGDDFMRRKIKDVINSANNGDVITKEEEYEIFSYFRHITNARKTDEEFEIYCKMAEEKGIPKPERDSTIRPLNEYSNCAYRDENGKWRMKNR